MYRIEFYETRNDFEDRRSDAFIDCLNWAEAVVVIEKLIENNPGAVVAVGQ